MVMVQAEEFGSFPKPGPGLQSRLRYSQEALVPFCRIGIQTLLHSSCILPLAQSLASTNSAYHRESAP
jgi:hypothetical protein